MIPYEQLVAALASWRQRQGLPAGPADYLGEPATAPYDYQPAAAGGGYGGGYSGGYGGGYGEDVVELSDDMMDSVVEEQSSPWSVEAVEVEETPQAVAPDTQDEEYIEPPKPEPEPEPPPAPSGRRKRRK